MGRRFRIEGHDLGYPTEFRDGSTAGGMFVVDAGVANELIAESGFEVAEILPGRAIMVFTGVHYSDTDCGVYEETAFAFFVKKLEGSVGLPYLGMWADIIRGQVASYTWKLQVTTRLSQYAGLEMWGFPKTLEDIDFEVANGFANITLKMDGREVLRYRVRAAGSGTPAPITSTVYSVFEGAQQVSYLTQAYRDAGYRPGGGRLELGSHPLADELRALGLPRRPLLATWMGHLAFSMTAPEKL